ncbi:hypothetical protein H7E67_02160 [Clostridium gasigenes]|nr:hypothetical protein [Clostridium gasigenes]MBB6622225.1 hypothetical protein [Clostridium gasigenes]
MYQFLLNMWIMRRLDEVYLQARVEKNQITQEQYEIIALTEQVTIS